MRSGSISLNSLVKNGSCLAGSYYLPEDQAAATTLSSPRFSRDPLISVCVDHGIFRVSVSKRPPMSGAQSRSLYLSPVHFDRLDVGVDRTPLSFRRSLPGRVLLREGMIVLSSSGPTLGKVAYIRRDMDGLLGSRNLIRIIPDSRRVHPGYLFAYLSSRLGKLTIRSCSHGTSIKNIELRQLFNLPVLRLGSAKEEQIGREVLEAQEYIFRGVMGLTVVTTELHESFGLLESV